ncbi:type VI secretion system-associated FHA domain protein TagH [Caulobacter sp. CCUG 60055]|uniref:type VI secretion system-associated FHA domain protein TagH n=1 Tax=Caulobacter sp. CCUG 60055 TaxID=2100090 RepID=UPI001FA7005D|nr:type VI secretion system-associated FHA domain protein TagH [Caulobacter sp. CCUG 60055]MBQ1542661.1 type VI secretion system-associated FHA domain protein TagH [Caulobacteraceae bacterium]MCI3179464.1 type VI secretion system-associated FHA domain protein TagH [Caulobacter sp. CCUG 60055]
MMLVLTIKSLDQLENGEAARLTLDRHGARIGRSPHMDWCLPDRRSYISSAHCEIEYREGAYWLVDRSTNGTFVNRSPSRLAAPHPIADGDVILIGHYEIEARLDGAVRQDASEAAPPAWGGWDSHAGREPVGVDPSKWDQPAPRAAISGLGSASSAWAAPRVEPPPPPPSSAWVSAPPPGDPPSAWSSEPPAAAPPSAIDVWGQLAATNEVDWARGGFGSPAPAFQDAAPASPPAAAWGAPSPSPPPPAPPQRAARPASPPAQASDGAEWSAFLQGAGLRPDDLQGSRPEAFAAAGALLRRLVGGMVVMMEARARAKAQMGAQNTSLEFDGNNPLKFARSAERALAQMLNQPDRGFMPADRAVEDAFRDLQAHQLATLTAMQGALAATLDRFSPAAIRARAETTGLLSKIVPGARAATLWQAYEREFEGVNKGSDEAFMEVFAKEFREAYERIAGEMKARSER